MRRRACAWILAGLGGLPAAGCDGGPPAPTAGSEPGWFTDVAGERGLAFSIERAAPGDFFMPDSMAAGCALFDADGDGDLDVYLVNGVRGRGARLRDPRGANRLYRQESDGRFADVTAASGAGDEGYGMGAATGDMDNDGDLDLYVTNYGLDVLYRNEGGGAFTDVTASAGIADDAWGASAGFFDFDLDGDLDLFVTNYLAYDPSLRGVDEAGRPEYPAPSGFPGVPDLLYRNEGGGTFTDVSAASGIGALPGRGLGVAFLDLDGDNLTDVYVANDHEPNFAWINDGAGGFTEQALRFGLAVNEFGRPEASMGVAVGDIDGDGSDELLVTHLVQETNTLYRRLERGGWHDDTAASRLGPPGIDFTGFGASFVDVELDGDLDLLVANGRVLRRVAHPGARLDPHWTPYAEPNQLFLNDGAGRFAEARGRGGALSADVEVSRGLAVGDLDGDGDLDAVVTNGNGTVCLYRNDAPRAGRWLIVRAVDPALRRDALGAVVEVAAGGSVRRRLVQTADSYLSARDPRAHFGLGDASAVDAVIVTWPGGEREVFPGGPADRALEVRRGEGAPDAAGGREGTR